MKYTLELEIRPGDGFLCERCPLLVYCPGGMYDELLCTATEEMAKAPHLTGEHALANAYAEIESKCPLKSTSKKHDDTPISIDCG